MNNCPPPFCKALVYTMIFRHLSYCNTAWSHVGVTTLNPVYLLYKRIQNLLHYKTSDYHFCNILENMIFSIVVTTVLYK